MPSWFAAGAWTLLALGLLIFLVRWKNGTILVIIRDALFTELTERSSELVAGPGELRSLGFLEDPASLREAWRARSAQIGYGTGLRDVSHEPDDTEKAKRLVLLFSIGGGAGCGTINDLGEKLVAIREGYGCCSDHCEVFLALAAMAGLPAREVITSSHSGVEVFDRRRRRWVFLDPQFAMLARGADQEYLSLWEIRRLVLAGVPIQFEFFGGPGHFQSMAHPKFRKYYGAPEVVTCFRVTFGNNVLENDRLAARLGSTPKILKHVIGHLMGVRPPSRMYVDDTNRAALRSMIAINRLMGRPIRSVTRALFTGR